VGVGTGLELEDFCDESDVVRKELMEEVDIGDLSKRSLFRIGEFCMRVSQSPLLPLPFYMPPVTKTPQQILWLQTGRSNVAKSSVTTRGRVDHDLLLPRDETSHSISTSRTRRKVCGGATCHDEHWSTALWCSL
jgi:hypothetical protein